jgi:hypothetical protein
VSAVQFRPQPPLFVLTLLVKIGFFKKSPFQRFATGLKNVLLFLSLGRAWIVALRHTVFIVSFGFMQWINAAFRAAPGINIKTNSAGRVGC